MEYTDETSFILINKAFFKCPLISFSTSEFCCFGSRCKKPPGKNKTNIIKTLEKVFYVSDTLVPAKVPITLMPLINERIHSVSVHLDICSTGTHEKQ